MNTIPPAFDCVGSRYTRPSDYCKAVLTGTCRIESDGNKEYPKGSITAHRICLGPKGFPVQLHHGLSMYCRATWTLWVCGSLSQESLLLILQSCTYFIACMQVVVSVMASSCQHVQYFLCCRAKRIPYGNLREAPRLSAAP